MDKATAMKILIILFQWGYVIKVRKRGEGKGDNVRDKLLRIKTIRQEQENRNRLRRVLNAKKEQYQKNSLGMVVVPLTKRNWANYA